MVGWVGLHWFGYDLEFERYSVFKAIERYILSSGPSRSDVKEQAR